MPEARNELDLKAESEAATEAKAPQASPGETVRKPYRAPHLRYLGSVKELTAAGESITNNDGVGFKGSG